MEEEVIVTPPAAEGTPLTPTEGAITLEGLHAMILEMQATVQNLQAVADQATPVEPAAEEVVEEPAADDAALLEEEPAAETAPEEDLEEVDKLLSAN